MKFILKVHIIYNALHKIIIMFHLQPLTEIDQVQLN